MKKVNQRDSLKLQIICVLLTGLKSIRVFVFITRQFFATQSSWVLSRAEFNSILQEYSLISSNLKCSRVFSNKIDTHFGMSLQNLIRCQMENATSIFANAKLLFHAIYISTVPRSPTNYSNSTHGGDHQCYKYRLIHPILAVWDVIGLYIGIYEYQ